MGSPTVPTTIRRSSVIAVADSLQVGRGFKQRHVFTVRLNTVMWGDSGGRDPRSGYWRRTSRAGRATGSDVTVTVRLHLKCDGARAETRFRLWAKRTSPFKSAGASVQSTTGSRGLRISGSNAGYIMFRGSVKGTGYPLHSPVSLSLPLPCVTVCHHISTGLCVWPYHTKNPTLPPPADRRPRPTTTVL